MSEAKTAANLSERITVTEFFENAPPGKIVGIKDICTTVRNADFLQAPAIQLHCETESCQGIRFFEPSGLIQLWANDKSNHFLDFVCRNCKQTTKTYSFCSLVDSTKINGELMKYGEYPPFGPPTPAKVITLIGGERDYFLKGRRAENQGLGIAAFAYYRRVVENQKSRIIDEIIRVAEKIGATPEVIADLVAAKAEVQFSTAVSAIKHGIPQALLINGQNPLTLLHSALSEGLHAQTDEDCLELATIIREVLTGLVERMGIVLKEEVQLNAAVSRLLQAKNKKPIPVGAPSVKPLGQ